MSNSLSNHPQTPSPEEPRRTANRAGLKRRDYPKCPECGGPCAGALMTSGAVHAGGQPFNPGKWEQGESLWYAPSAISLYCVSGSCNYDHLLGELTTPVPPEE